MADEVKQEEVVAEEKQEEKAFDEWCDTNLVAETEVGVDTVGTEDIEDLTNLTAETANVDQEEVAAAHSYTVDEVAAIVSSGKIEEIETSVQCLVKAKDESITYCGIMYDKCFIMRKPVDGETRVVVTDAVQRIIGVCIDDSNSENGNVYDTVTVCIVQGMLCITRYNNDFDVIKSTGIASIDFFSNVTMINKVGDKFIIGCSIVDTESGMNTQAIILVSDDFESSNIISLKYEMPAGFDLTGVQAEIRSVFLSGEDTIVFGTIANDKENFFVTLSQLDKDMQPGRFATVNAGVGTFKTVGSYAWFDEEHQLISMVGFYINDGGESTPFNASFDRNLNHVTLPPAN